jgi:hypothetical protein
MLTALYQLWRSASLADTTKFNAFAQRLRQQNRQLSTVVEVSIINNGFKASSFSKIFAKFCLR